MAQYPNHIHNFFLNRELDHTHTWRIPRPTLSYQSAKQSKTTGSISSSSNDTSTSSQKSRRSTTLLLNAKNLAKIQQENDKNPMTYKNNISHYLNNNVIIPKEKNHEDIDKSSITSSMNFTIINTNDQRATKRSVCRRHQLTILVVTMSCLFSIAIILAIYCLEQHEIPDFKKRVFQFSSLTHR